MCAMKFYALNILFALFSLSTFAVTELEGGSRACDALLTSESSQSSYRVEVFDRADSTIMNFSGSVLLAFGVGAHFRSAISKIPTDKDLILVLDSSGGAELVFDRFAKDLVNLLRPHTLRVRRNRRITTYVPDGGQCTSACLRLFMIGDRRIAHPNATFGFHGVGDIRTLGLVSAGAKKTIEVIGNWGVAGSFLRRLADRGIFDDALNEVTKLMPHQLAGSNILTEEALDFGIPTLRP